MKTDPTQPLLCADCGQSVPNPTRTVTAHQRQWRLENGEQLPVQAEFTFALCERDSDRRWRVGAIISDHPDVFGRMGGRTYQESQIDGALMSLDMLGTEDDRARRMTATDDDVLLLLSYLGGRTIGARFEDAHLETQRPTGDVRGTQTERWAHIHPERLENLRSSAAHLFRARIRPVDSPLSPVSVPTDADRPGCLLCGIGHVMSSERDPRSAWGGRRWKLTPSTVGGRLDAGPVHGYLCGDCSHAASEAGGMGLTAVEQAFTAFIGERLPTGWEVPGAVAWATLPEGTKPNKTPWAHQTGHDELRAQLRRAKGLKSLNI